MWWVGASVLGFVLVVVCVAALARSTTARWEREQRRARRRRAGATAVATPGQPAGAAVRLRGAVLRAAAPGMRAVRTPLSASARMLSTARSRVVPRRRPAKRVRPAARATGDGTAERLGAPGESATATDPRPAGLARPRVAPSRIPRPHIPRPRIPRQRARTRRPGD
jgi:hypothetical protein